MLCFFISTFVFSLITGVIRGWQLTLILISMVPLIGLASGIFVKIQVSEGKGPTTTAENLLNVSVHVCC